MSTTRLRNCIKCKNIRGPYFYVIYLVMMSKEIIEKLRSLLEVVSDLHLFAEIF